MRTSRGYLPVKTAMEKEQVRERERSRSKTVNAVLWTVHEKNEFLLDPLLVYTDTLSLSCRLRR